MKVELYEMLARQAISRRNLLKGAAGTAAVAAMGPGMMGQGMGQGMMGQGMGRGHGMFGQAPCGQQPAVEVTADSVKTHMEAWIARKGNSHIKIGAVTQQSDGTILATIVTKKENALVDKFVIDPKTNTRKRVE